MPIGPYYLGDCYFPTIVSNRHTHLFISNVIYKIPSTLHRPSLNTLDWFSLLAARPSSVCLFEQHPAQEELQQTLRLRSSRLLRVYIVWPFPSSFCSSPPVCESCVLLHSIPHSTVFIQYSSSSRWRPVFPLTVLSIKFPSAAVLCCAVRRWCWPMFGQPGKVGRDPVIIRSTTPILHRKEKGYSLYSTRPRFKCPRAIPPPPLGGSYSAQTLQLLYTLAVCR
jgi:hypothetical protein